MKIGNLTFEHGVFLAPMAGFTDLPFRTICKEYGCEFTYTEMVSAKALCYGDKKTKLLLTPEDERCAVQIFGREPDMMKKAAKMLEEEGFPMIDVNMGCPAPKIVDNHEGSYLLKEPELAGEIISEIKSCVKIPVTAKMRRGFEQCPDAALKVAKLVAQAGADALTVHPRTREQFYSGKADRSFIKRVKEIVSCPVIGNGDIDSPESASEMLETTGCDGVMIGREALSRPWIFRQINEGDFIPSGEERLSVIKKHYSMAMEFYGEYVAVPLMRKQLHCYIKGLPGAAKLREKINTINTYEEIKTLLDATVF